MIFTATEGASMIAPSTTVSWARASSPLLTSSYPVFVFFSSTAFTELDPISKPINDFVFPRFNIARPLTPHPASFAGRFPLQFSAWLFLNGPRCPLLFFLPLPPKGFRMLQQSSTTDTAGTLSFLRLLHPRLTLSSNVFPLCAFG